MLTQLEAIDAGAAEPVRRPLEQDAELREGLAALDAPGAARHARHAGIVDVAPQRRPDDAVDTALEVPRAWVHVGAAAVAAEAVVGGTEQPPLQVDDNPGARRSTRPLRGAIPRMLIGDDGRRGEVLLADLEAG